ncbi:hypothetical protein KSS87_015821 [Heliosperma pusillum]|nr:hypothetical protein KSS87_015821 [Heliosperma pusillum]
MIAINNKRRSLAGYFFRTVLMMIKREIF